MGRTSHPLPAMFMRGRQSRSQNRSIHSIIRSFFTQLHNTSRMGDSILEGLPSPSPFAGATVFRRKANGRENTRNPGLRSVPDRRPEHPFLHLTNQVRAKSGMESPCTSRKTLFSSQLPDISRKPVPFSDFGRDSNGTNTGAPLQYSENLTKFPLHRKTVAGSQGRIIARFPQEIQSVATRPSRECRRSPARLRSIGR